MRNELAIAYLEYRSTVIYNRETNKFEKGKGKDYVRTCGGKTYEIAEWMTLANAYIDENGLKDLFLQIREYVKNTCLWVKPKELDRYSADCLLHESYKHWKDFAIQERLLV